MSIVVSDTSPIRALAFIGRTGLLSKLFGRVFVPPAVAIELLEPAAEFESIDIEDFPFIEVVVPIAVNEVAKLRETLDWGESEALVLARELKVDQVLIDELAGREVARQMGLGLIGTLGVLLKAKKAGLIDAIRPDVFRLIDDLGFFVSQKLLDLILELADEV